MAEKPSNSPNPPQIIGAPQRQSSKMELYEYHKNAGTLGLFYDLYPELRPRAPEPNRGRRER
jgi:hypothetical protein